MELERINSQVFEKVKEVVPTFESFRVELAYRNILNIYSVIKELQMSIGGWDRFSLAVQGDLEKLSFMEHRRKQSYTQLQCLYIFVDIFVNVLLQEVLDSTQSRNSTHGLLKDYCLKLVESCPTIPQQSFLPVYCTVLYRNKIIIHQDVKRQFVYNHHANEEYSLEPIGYYYKIKLDEENSSKIWQLVKKYKDVIPELKHETNIWKQLEYLFYKIPLLIEKKWNEDRNEINKLIEYGGCPSMTANNIIEAVDVFIEKVAETISDVTLPTDIL